METLPWDRRARIGEVRDRIWSYISPASRYELPGLLVAAALLDWPEDDARRLGELQFLLSAEVRGLLEAMPQMARRLATAAAREEQWTSERLLGPVAWNRTLALRAVTGVRHVYVTAPARRVYQTPENELLVHVLDAIVQAARLGGWDQTVTRQGPAKILRDRMSDATRWQNSRMLSAVDRVPPTARSVARIRTGRARRRYAAVLSAYDKLVSLVEQLDRQAVREAIEYAGLVIADDARLFELLTTFQVMDGLRENGWTMQPFYLIKGKVHTRGRRRDGRPISLWYQTTPHALAPVSIAESRYRQVLAAHGFLRQHELRPDMVLRWTSQHGQDRWLLIECKLSQKKGVDHAARLALADLLAYRRSFHDTLSNSGQPYGLGIAWGYGLRPETSAEIALCTPDTLTEAIRQIII
jgi:hypothetical protein